MNTQQALARLQEWYTSNCDGEWEHFFGFKLETLDNPGWSISVDLDDTHQEAKIFQEKQFKFKNETQWLIVSKTGAKLNGACGPKELETMLVLVSEWLEPRR
jgi:hypothetical protein